MDQVVAIASALAKQSIPDYDRRWKIGSSPTGNGIAAVIVLTAGRALIHLVIPSDVLDVKLVRCSRRYFSD